MFIFFSFLFFSDKGDEVGKKGGDMVAIVLLEMLS